MSNFERRQALEDDSNINGKDFIIGALVGGIIGAGVALFLAPKSGRELRNVINTQTVSLKEKTGQIYETATRKGSELVEVAKQKSSSLNEAVSNQEWLKKVRLHKADHLESIDEDNYITIEIPAENGSIQRKLEETKKAFDETERNLNQ